MDSRLATCGGARNDHFGHMISLIESLN